MKAIIVNIFLIIYLINLAECGFFSSSIDKLKNKAKSVYKKNFGKGATLAIGGHKPNEYPGSNVKYKEENRAEWNDYYKCLNLQMENVNSQKTITPEAIIGFETSFVTMECKICLSPYENENLESVLWEWAGRQDLVLTPVEYTEHILLSPEDRTLKIFNLKEENTGQYVCKLGETVVAPYFLTVVNISEESMNEVHSPSAHKGPYSAPPQETAFGLILDTEWGKWSVCSTCDNIGRKHRLGYCNVYLKEHRNTQPQSLASNRSKRSDADEIKQTFEIFKYGIPCQSHILPDLVRRLPEVQSRKNEIMMGYCNVKCPERKVFEIRDKSGKVLEQADNSEGIYSLSQKLPPLEPTVERRLQYEAKGKDVVLECPGNINSDAPIQWQIGEKNVIAEKIAKESNGRIYLSITDRIHINKAKLTDSNIYSCWQLKELAGTIRLVVEKRFQLNFNHTIMLLGLVIILGTFLYVLIKVVATRELTKMP